MEMDLVFKGEKSTYELASALSKFAMTVYSALKDGFQPLRDMSVIGSAAVSDLMPVLSDVKQLKADLAEDKVAFLNSWAKAGEEFYDALMAK